MLKLTIALGAGLALAAPGAALANGHNGHGNHGQHAQGSHGQGDHARKKDKRANRTARGQVCPPGLQKKNPGCMPPGQWRKGDRLPSSWTAHYVRYSQLPDAYRSRYRDDRTNRYVYSNNRVFVVDAASRVIESVFGL